MNDDNPITSPEEDALGRVKFANKLALFISNLPEDKSVTIGLQGPWGSGKTSVVNLIEKQLEDSNAGITPVRFNPWGSYESASLVQDFFLLLKETICTNGKHDKDDIASSILAYANQLIPPIAALAGFSAIGQAAEAAVSLGSAIVEEKQSLEQLKQRIEKQLSKKRRRVLIIIDDIDRLPDEKIRSVFQLMASIANFPGINYLACYDAEIVSGALSRVQESKSGDYIDKIVNVVINLPQIKRSQLDDLAIDLIDRLSPDNQHTQSRSNPIIGLCICPLVKTARDVKRLENALEFAMVDYSERIDYNDYAAITAIRTLAPHLFQWIVIHSNQLCGHTLEPSAKRNSEPNASDKMTEATAKTIIDEPCRADKVDTATALAAIATLFPRFSIQINFSIFPVKYSDTDLKIRKRIASREIFQLFLEENLDDFTFPSDMINAVISESSEKEAAHTLKLLLEKGYAQETIEHVSHSATKINKNRIYTVLETIAESLYSAQETILTSYPYQPLWLYLDQRQVDKLAVLSIEKATADNIEEVANWLRARGDAFGVFGERVAQPQKQLITQNGLRDAEHAFLKTVRELAKEQLPNDHCPMTLWLWRHIDRDSYDDFIDNVLKDSNRAITLSTLFANEVRSIAPDGNESISGWLIDANKIDTIGRSRLANLVEQCMQKDRAPELFGDNLMKIAAISCYLANNYGHYHGDDRPFVSAQTVDNELKKPNSPA